MRQAFIRALQELAEREPRVLLLTADLGYGVVERFATALPGQFINVGVAEQNMIGIATGLAESGFVPFAYSIASFASLRAYEFIRNGPVLHRLPVRIVGVGGGMEYGHQGLTHYALEDLAVMRVQPDITVIAPADGEQARAALLATWNRPGPTYFRLGKDDLPPLRGLDGRFAVDSVHSIREGRDAVLLAVGPIAHAVQETADLLAGEGISCEVIVVGCLNPIPYDALASALARFRFAMTIEAHYTVGGLGSMVAEVIATGGIDCRLVRRGIDSTPPQESGGAGYLAKRHGLAPSQLRDAVKVMLRT
jgi:transketolase